ncbi:MAG: BON domain-containing protein, partial [Aeromonadaceae bacterium]
MNKQLLWGLMATLPLLHGCAGLVVAGAATTAVVANDRRTFGSVIDDQNIELKAANAIAGRKDISNASRISATSMNGMLLLVGQTPYEQYKRESEQLVTKVEGVRHVYNELRIRKPIPFNVQSNDAWITSKIKSQMLTTKGVDSTRFKV